MKFFKITLVIVYFLSANLFSDEVKIIELHPSLTDDDVISSDENQIGDNNIEVDAEVSDEINIINETSDEINILTEGEEVENTGDSPAIFSILDYWMPSSKDNLDFLFNNINVSSSRVMNFYFIDSLIEFSQAPQLYTQAEFDNLRIKTLIKMGQRQEILKVLNNIETYETHKNYYDLIKLDSYLTTNKLSKACNFKDSLQESNEEQDSIILKVSIFCSFLQNKLEEADLLNSLLLDTQDEDEYFQKIYFNLKNDVNESIDISQGSFDESSLSLYSAMIRIGSLPFTEKFLEFDSTDLTMPIILNSSTDISLRLKSAHKAYEAELFNSESLSALYQSVDFSLEELNNWEATLKNLTQNPEIGMALLFQNARVQILPITRLESLKEFWSFAIANDLEKLAYGVSRNLIESTEPSVELTDYSILLARAHIFNRNFQQAEKWILFVENYVSQNNEIDQTKIDDVKFLYNLQKSDDKEIFIQNLEDILVTKIKKEGTLDGYNETLKTIFSIILNEKEIIDKINYEKKVIDKRLMPSNYIINTINNSSKNNKLGELILAALVSLDGKSWKDVHPQHLKILLESFKKANLDNLFRDVILEIFEECKII